MIDGRGQVLGANGVAGGILAVLVGSAVHPSAGDPSSGQDRREALGPVLASRHTLEIYAVELVCFEFIVKLLPNLAP